MGILRTIFTDRFKISEERLDICRKCDEFESRTSKCKQCGCFMDYKTLLMWAECPLDKWGPHQENINTDEDKESQ